MTTETSSIDEKKNDPASKIDFKGFAKNYISSIIFSIGFNIFILGTIGLYTTKVAQANILPDNPDLAPYTIFDRIINNDIPIDINIMKPNFMSEDKETFSQKAIFDSQKYLDSFSNSFLCSLKKAAIPTYVLANIPLYYSSVYDNLIPKIFYIINAFFFKMSYINESVFMFFYGLLYSFIWTIIFLCALFFSLYCHIANIPQIFRYVAKRPKINDPALKPLNEPKWESEENISLFRFWRIIIFLIYLFIFFVPSIFVSAITVTVYGFFAPLYATYKIKDDKTNKTKGIFDFIKNTFKYKKLYFFILATISLVSNGINHFGSASAISFGIAVLVAWFMGLYGNPMPESGVNGFSVGVRETPIQSVVNVLNTKKLVQICSIIPMVDEKIDKILNNPKIVIREIKEIEGGGKKVTFNNNIEMFTFKPNNKKNVDTTNLDTTNLDTTTLDTTKSETIKPETIKPETIKPEMTTLETIKPETTKSETTKSESVNPETINTETTNTELMTGGKKMKRSYNKKYNIKFS
jgi:hypothetical protein